MAALLACLIPGGTDKSYLTVGEFRSDTTGAESRNWKGLSKEK